MLLTQLRMSTPFERTIQFVPVTGFNSAYRALYGPLNITLLVGPNGSGKTAAMSLVARVFQYLQRNRERIRSDFCLGYEIERQGARRTIEIRGENGEISVGVDGGPARLLEPWSNDPRPRRERDNCFAYDAFSELLPARVVVSAFSTRGEYPQRRPSNYVGDKRLAIFDVGRVYGKHHFGIGSLSGGIAALARLFMHDAPAIQPLKSLLGMTFAGRIRIHDPVSGDIPEYLVNWHGQRRPPVPGQARDGWTPLTEELLAREASHEIYFNDLDLRRDGRPLSLAIMSSGEKVLFVRLLSLLSSVEMDSLVLIEEPELHLDPSWTKQWITLLHALFAGKRAHFIIATHSYSFINAVFEENIVSFSGQNPHTPEFNTFLANEAELSARFFGASRKPNLPEAYLLELLRRDENDALKRLFGRLGESRYRFQVFAQLQRLADRDVEGK